MSTQTRRLSDGWELFRFPEASSPVSSPADLQHHQADAIPAAVPGNVELDLMRAGVLPDVFAGSNIFALRALEGDEWWYRTHFDAPAAVDGNRAELVFHGLDCLASIWLNGTLIGRTDNMLIEHRLDVTGALRQDAANELVVRLGSAVLAARGYPLPPVCQALPTNYEQLAIRKAPHMYDSVDLPDRQGATREKTTG